MLLRQLVLASRCIRSMTWPELMPGGAMPLIVAAGYML